MGKYIEFLRSSTPDNPVLGYGDHVAIYAAADGSMIDGCHCSTCPNPYRPSDNVPWEKAYAMLSPQILTWECLANNNIETMGKCLLFNGGGRCDTLNANLNHDGQYYAEGVFCHIGQIGSHTVGWRGSKACFTIPPENYERFFSYFQIGETGTASLKSFIQNLQGITA